MMNNNKDGFSLMELLVVIVIISILVGLLSPILLTARESARRARAKTELRELERACMVYKQTYDSYPFASGPMTPENTRILAGNNPNQIQFMNFKKRAFSDGFVDPWGTPYNVEFLNDEDIVTTWTYKTRIRCANAKASRY